MLGEHEENSRRPLERGQGPIPCAHFEELDVNQLNERLIGQINRWCKDVPGWRPIVPTEVQRWHQQKEDHPRRLMLTRYLGRTVGACLVSSDLPNRVSRLDFLVIAPEVRRNGLGRRLLARAEAIAIKHGSPKVMVTIGVENLAGQALLRTSGYDLAWYNLRMARSLEGVMPLQLPEGYRVRLFCGADRPRLLRVINDAFHDVDPDWQDWDKEQLRHQVLERQDVRWVSIFLAEHDGQVVGAATAWCDADRESGQPRGWLQWLAVVPSHRRRGLGHALVDAVVNRLLEEGLAEAHLITNTRLQPAIALYRSLGFREVSKWSVFQKALSYR